MRSLWWTQPTGRELALQSPVVGSAAVYMCGGQPGKQPHSTLVYCPFGAWDEFI